MNETTPKISVIVPVYKTEAYLHRCVDSILAQTFQDFEVLLIDDGSPDRSGEICDEYARKDRRVRVFHKENGGVSSARNVGLDNARGEWICFVDSDDWVEEEMFATICSFMQSKGQIDILFWGFQCEYPEVQNGVKQKAKKELKYAYNDTAETILRSCYLLEKMESFGWTWNKMHRRDIIQSNNICFDETVSLQEDHLFALDYVRYVENLMVVPYYPYHYRVLNDSLMRRPISYQDRKKVATLLLQNRLDFVVNKDFAVVMAYKDFACKSFISSSFYNLSILYKSESDAATRKQEFSLFKKSLRAYPYRSVKFVCLWILTRLPYQAFGEICRIWFKGR